jgi:hypothetical protein
LCFRSYYSLRNPGFSRSFFSLQILRCYLWNLFLALTPVALEILNPASCLSLALSESLKVILI